MLAQLAALLRDAESESMRWRYIAEFLEEFAWLGERLHRRGLTADVYVFGGAAMALAYDARRATRDIDAVYQPHGAVLEEAWAVADEVGLPRRWLNEQASAYVASGGDSSKPRRSRQASAN